MFVYYRAPTWKVVRYYCIIAILQEMLLDVRVSLRSYRKGCLMLMYHSDPSGKVVRCSCIIVILQERLLDVRVS
jgi:hypothetical protein